MTTAIDLFAGLGGWSTGARMAGVNVLWAANHWPVAVEWHGHNHPGAIHVCQDLHQADWSKVPSHDIMMASPCCHGHSKARGKTASNPQHDASRATAWRPIGTITTRDRWALVDGDRMRMLTANENLLAMSFPADTLVPDNHRLTVHMAGNAVPPVAARHIIEALERAA